MARIFFAIATFAVLLLVTNIVLGLMTGDYNGVAKRYQSVQQDVAALQGSSSPNDERLADQQEEQHRLGRQLEALERQNVAHLLFGLAASLVTLLVNSITITYFIGTSRWCREVVEVYSIDVNLAERSNLLKRRTFPWALAGILLVLLIVCLGGAADPFGANASRSAAWVVPHFVAALVGTGLIAWSFLVQVGNIGANYEVIQDILDEVRRVRAERGLDGDHLADSEV